MAGDWIPWCKGLARKPEVLAVARTTGRTRREVAAALMEFWEWADSETIDGQLPGVTLEDLPGLVPGTDAAFWASVVAAGWLVPEPGRLVLPQFERWMGQSAKKRLANTKRQRVSRSARDQSATTEQDSTEEKEFPPLPPELDTPEFKKAWEDWMAYRAERRPFVTIRAAAMAFKRLAGWGPQRAVAAIEHSIGNSYQGIFEDFGHGGGGAGHGRGVGQDHRAGRVEPPAGKYAGRRDYGGAADAP